MSEDLAKYAKVLVVGADGLGCETKRLGSVRFPKSQGYRHR